MNHTKGRHSVSRGVGRSFLVCLAGLALSLLPPLMAHAGTIYTDASATGANNGTSWLNAYTDLQDALGVAGSGDQIWVAKGIYTPGTVQTASFQLKNGVALHGGYPTGGGQRDWANNETILSGDIGTLGVNTDNCYHVATVSGTDDTAVLDGFTVTGGNANLGGDKADPDSWGGGMYNDNSSPTVQNCTFSGNAAYGHGGGMYNDNSSPTVQNCTFSGNSANWGGGMSNFHSSSTVQNCTFSDNVADFSGGGMDTWGGSPTVQNCTFFNNNTAFKGGGMNNGGSSEPTVQNCTFSGNSAPWGLGGGMSNSSDSIPTVQNCTFSGNQATAGDGGGMYNLSSSIPTVQNCTFFNNTANNGGGMYNQESSNTTVTNCTFSGNQATAADGGGGMYNDNSSPTVKNTILAGNTPDDCDGLPDSRGYNLEGGTSCGCTKPTDQRNTDPLLGPLADNGGPTETCALLAGSSAIDAGSCTDISGNPVSYDQRGVARPFGSNCDIGAYEATFGDLNSDGAIDLLDARLCAQIAQGYITGTAQQRAAADVDSDGDVDADDVTILSEYILGMRTTLP